MEITEQITSLKSKLEELPACKDVASLKQVARVAMGIIAEIEENPELEQLESAKDKDIVIDNLRGEIKGLKRNHGYELEDLKGEYEDKLRKVEDKLKDAEETITTLQNQETLEMSEKVDDLLSKEILDKLTSIEILVKSSTDSLNNVEFTTKKMNLVNNATSKSVGKLVQTNLNLTDYVKSYTKQSEATYDSVSKLKQDNSNLNDKVEDVQLQYEEISTQYSEVTKDLEETNDLVAKLEDTVESAVEEVKGFRAMFQKLRGLFGGKE